MIHTIKIKKCYWDEVWSGRKTFEIRKNDRDYKVGDMLHFIPIDEENKEIPFVNEAKEKYNNYLITYIFHGGEYGVDEGFCVMAIRQIVIFKNARETINRVRDLISCLYGSPLDNILCPVVDEDDSIIYDIQDVLKGGGTSQGITYLGINSNDDINELEEDQDEPSV